ncbi:MAG: hypothetical protein JWN44_1993 [Myxococcales bacterium]|nr:hypothetical protein [Myxococcales bacterium]
MRILPLACLLLVGACSPSPATDETANALSPTARPKAQLDFQAGWVQVQRGALVRGGHVDITYARARLPACPAPTVFAYARFQPGGQQLSSDEAFGFDVPADATSVELWFHALAPGCEQWDSNYGRNWKFPVVAASPAAVGWAGDWGSSTNRACQHGAGVPQPITIDEYMRERACIFVDADVWVPGVTDVAAPHPEWLQAGVRWAKDAQAPADAWLEYQGLVGHNARFRWTVPYEVRNFADWTTVSYSFRFSTDGNSWVRAAQPSGADWTLARAFTLPTP